MAISTAPRRRPLDRACAAVAIGVPLLFAVARAADAPQLRDDVALLRAIGGGTSGVIGGATSAALATWALLVPLGPRLLRLALVAAVFAAVAAGAVYALARRTLASNLEMPRLGPVLAALAALTAGLSTAWQREATVGGGATVGAALALLTLTMPLGDVRACVSVGALLGACAVESVPGAAVALLALVARGALGARPPPRAALLGVLAALVVAAAIASPALVHAPLASGDRLAIDPPLARAGVVAAFARDVGPFALVLACVGAALGVVRGRLRADVVPLVVVVAAELAAPLGTAGVLSPDPLGVVHVMGIGALAVTAALAVQSAVALLLASRLPTAHGAAVLLVVLDLTMVTIASEEASLHADAAACRGTEAWTDEALERAPERAALLVRSRAAAWRLLAARLADGARPDVLVVPLPLLGRPRVAGELLTREPAIEGALRDVALEGRPGESALSKLADARPVLVEVDPAWDRRVLSHLYADAGWLRFAAEPRGPSDRRAGYALARASDERVLQRAKLVEGEDRGPTLLVLRHQRDAATLAAGLGDRAEATALLEALAARSHGDAWVAELTRRVAQARTGSVEVRGLPE